MNSVLQNFSWSRVRECLLAHERLVNEKQLFAFDNQVWLDMPYSDFMLSLSTKRLGLYDREDWTKLLYIVLPPKDVQLLVDRILERYGRKEDTTTIH